MALLVNNLFPGHIEPDTVVGGCIDIFENAWPNWDETIQAVDCTATGGNCLQPSGSLFQQPWPWLNNPS
jgi:hypothetical protein